MHAYWCAANYLSVGQAMERHKCYIQEHGEDMPEVQDWRWCR